MPQEPNRYSQLIARIFAKHYRKGRSEISFERKDIEETAKLLGIRLPKNLGDVVYSFRYRADLPESITGTARPGFEWIIRPAGRSKYTLALTRVGTFAPNRDLAVVKVPDATPGIITKYAFSDEQSILARIRYNRLIDIFTGVTCYSLQNHLRTSVRNMGQVETDEVYLGIDKHGVHYVFPVQAKGRKDKIGVVQIEQDFSLCAEKFPRLIRRPLAAQFVDEDTIALFEFVMSNQGVKIISEKHYHLVDPSEISEAELEEYKRHVAR